VSTDTWGQSKAVQQGGEREGENAGRQVAGMSLGSPALTSASSVRAVTPLTECTRHNKASEAAPASTSSSARGRSVLMLWCPALALRMALQLASSRRHRKVFDLLQLVPRSSKKPVILRTDSALSRRR